MKAIIVVFAILLFAPPTFAQFTPTVQPQGQMQTWPPPGQAQMQRPQMPPQDNLGTWRQYNRPLYQDQQKKIQEQWQHSAAPGITGVVLPPPAALQWPGQTPE
jgi:hypothetical protein